MRVVLLIAFVLSVFSQAVAAEERRVEVYSALGTGVSVLAEIANAILDGEGRVIPDEEGNRLLVVATAEKHAILQELFKETGRRATQNVQLTVRFLGGQQGKSAQANVHGSVIMDQRGGRYQARPSISQQTHTTSHDMQQLLVAANGREASLRVGESLPYFEWTVDHRRYHSSVHVGTRWQDVGAFLIFQPIIQSDGQTILIRLTPEIRGRTTDMRRESYRFTQLQTEVYVRNGQPMQIGGLAEANTIYHRFLIGGSRRRESQTLNIEIVPRILP